MWFKRKKSKTPVGKAREFITTLLAALLLALLLKASVAGAYFVPSGSMRPTLLIGDHFIVTMFSYDFKLPFTNRVLLHMGDPDRGDVVVFKNPQGSGPDLVKRIVGLPGEVIEISGRRLLVNGRRIPDPWGRWSNPASLNAVYGPFKVPAGKYFVMGDNRDNSYDSRFWRQGRGGFVPRGDIRGRAQMILWSWREFPTSLRLSRSGSLVR